MFILAIVECIVYVIIVVSLVWMILKWIGRKLMFWRKKKEDQ